MLRFLYYCRLFHLISRRRPISKYGELVSIFVIMFLLLIPIYVIASNYVPDVNSVIINEAKPINGATTKPHINYTHYGNITDRIILFDSMDTKYMRRLPNPFNISGNLEFLRNNSGILINLNDSVELEGYTDPFPIESKICFYIDVLAITGNPYISLKMYDYEATKQVLNGHQVLEFTYRVKISSSRVFYEYKSFKIIIESRDGEARIFLGRIWAVAESTIPLAPININYYAPGDFSINNSYIEKGEELYLFGINDLYLVFEYYSPSINKLLSIYVSCPVDLVYFEKNVTINGIYLYMDPYVYSDEPIVKQLRVPENMGLSINVTLPLYNISLTVLYYNDLAEIEYIDIHYEGALSSLLFISKEVSIRYNHFFLFLIPWKYSIDIGVKGSFRDFLVSLSITVKDRNMVIKVVLNACNLNGIVLRIDTLILALAVVFIGFLILVMPLRLPAIREKYQQVLRRPIFYSIIALIASALTPSIIMVQYNGYLNQIEQFMITEFPLIMFQKSINERVYGAKISLIGLLYSFLFALIWFFFTLIILIKETNKPSINVNLNHLVITLIISITAKIIYLSLPLIMQLNSPIRLLAILPGPGIFLYACFVLLLITKIKKDKELKLF